MLVDGFKIQSTCSDRNISYEQKTFYAALKILTFLKFKNFLKFQSRFMISYVRIFVILLFVFWQTLQSDSHHHDV